MDQHSLYTLYDAASSQLTISSFVTSDQGINEDMFSAPNFVIDGSVIKSDKDGQLSTWNSTVEPKIDLSVIEHETYQYQLRLWNETPRVIPEISTDDWELSNTCLCIIHTFENHGVWENMVRIARQMSNRYFGPKKR